MQARATKVFLRRLLAGAAVSAFALALVLGCASAPTPQPPGYEDLFANASELARNGHGQAALGIYGLAAAADPSRKEPWQQMASMHMAAARPVHALVAADEALQRDPSDALANEVYIASAMQVSRQAMQRLLAAGVEPSEDDLRGAQQLVSMLGLVFGDDELISDEVKARYAERAVQQFRRAQARHTQRPPPQEKSRPPPDPLEVLGGD